MAMFLPLSAFADGVKNVDLTFKNAPEGTCFIDILINIDESSPEYTQFNEPQKADLDRASDVNVYSSIGADSEIAKYNEDGYVSFSLHDTNCRGLFRHGDDTFYIFMNQKCEEIFDQHSWKAAYVDMEGNVLGVTDVATKIESDEKSLLAADGSKLVYYSLKPLDRVFKGVVKLMIAGALLILAAIVGIVYLISKLHKRMGIPDIYEDEDNEVSKN